jgi:hypothetical protein
MIKFPKPFDWFQKKVWRLYWIEWFIIFFILWTNSFVEELIVPNYPRITLTEWLFSIIFCVTIASCFALPMALASKKLLHLLFEIIHALFLIPLLTLPCDFKAGDFKPIHMVLDLLENVLKYISSLNYRYIISRFLIDYKPEEILDASISKSHVDQNNSINFNNYGEIKGDIIGGNVKIEKNQTSDSSVFNANKE